MTKKEYIEKIKQTILNRLKFHAPVLYDDKLDLQILKEFDLDPSLPIFKISKPISKEIAKALILSKKEKNFNLIIEKDKVSKKIEKLLKKIDYFEINQGFSPKNLIETINKLNINYSASTNYNPIFKDKFFKINDQIQNPSYNEFCLSQSGIISNIDYTYKEFLLNGSNFYLKLKNTSDSPQKISVELNIPLPKGYYYFKKINHSVIIENLLSKEKLFLNHLCQGVKFCFSEINGLENSIFSCINAKISLNLPSKSEKFVFFNFSNAAFNLKTQHNIEKFLALSIQKSSEVFNLRVKTKNPKFDYFFNKTLPQKIWINWINQKYDENLEQKYSAYKRLFVIENGNITLKNFKDLGLKEVGIFNGEYYKKIYIVSGDEKFLRIGNTQFLNIENISSYSLKSKEPINLCFGK